MVSNWNTKNSDYEFIEDEVRLYHLYVKRLDEIKTDLILSTPVRDENGGGKSNLPGRPVEQIVISLFADARIARLEKTIKAVKQAYDELTSDKRAFVDYVFWNPAGTDVANVLSEFNISYRTYNRWKRAFLLRVAMQTGDYRGDV
jgi:RinA family phage transcriptional activator